MTFRILGLALTTVLSLASPGAGQNLPEKPEGPILDLAEVLDATEEARILGQLDRTLAETGVEVMVVTVPDVADHGGAGLRLETYAKALFDSWGVGGRDRDDGILILVATTAGEARLALGPGYDPVYDKRAALVLSSAILPEFRAGRISGGIEAGIALTRAQLVVPFLAGQPVSATDGFEPPAAGGNSALWVGLMGLGGIAGLVAFQIFRSSRKRKTCPRCGEPTLSRRFEVIEPPSGLSSGTGLEHCLCSSCGFTDRRSYAVGRLGGKRGSAGALDRSASRFASSSRPGSGRGPASW